MLSCPINGTSATLALLLTACGSGATEPTPGQVVGTYALQSVAGRPLPTSITGTSTIIVVSQATRILRADGTCVDTQHRTRSYGPYPASTSDRTVTCTWALRGNTLAFTFAVAGGDYYEQAVTTATVARDGGFTETTSSPESPGGYYPRVWTR